MKQFIGKGLKGLVKGSPNLNVLNILRSLIEDSECVVYIPINYANEKKTTSDPRIHFIPIEAGKSIVAKSIQSNKERFNFSINGEVDVYVEYPNEDGTVTLLPRKIFRSYTVVRDGKLNIEHVVAKLSEDTFNTLRSADVLYYNGIKVADNHDFVPEFLYKVKLTDIPIVSYAWAQPQQIGLYGNLEVENKLSATLTEVNKIIKAFKESGVDVISSDDSIYYNEPYLGETRKGDKVECNCITYEVNDSKNEVIQEYIDKAELNVLSANLVKKHINKELSSLRFIDRCIVMAIEQSQTKGNFDWSEPKTSGRKIIKESRTCQVAGLGKMYELVRTNYVKEF